LLGSKSVLECQVDDSNSLGYGLRDISQYVQQEEGLPATACCLIDDLADYLISTTMERLDIVMNGVKDRVFFWDENRRRTFFAAEVVPEVWDSAAFDVRFRNSLSMPAMPWTDQSYHGYLGAMKVYRSENGIQDYEPYELKDFFRCISGMYTHQNELHVGVQVIIIINYILNDLFTQSVYYAACFRLSQLSGLLILRFLLHILDYVWI